MKGIDPRQAIHMEGSTYSPGRSILSADPELILNELHSGYGFDFLPQYGAVQFPFNVGTAISGRNGAQAITNMLKIHFAPSTGLVHFVPFYLFPPVP